MRTYVAPLLAAFACAPAAGAGEAVRVRVLAVNDFHGALEATQGAGGAPALAQAIARARADATDVLLVSSGDLFGASQLASALAKEEPTIALFNHLGLQASAIGNHELDAGLEELRRLQTLASFPFVSANLVDARSGVPVFAPYRIVEVEGVRLAFVGATVRNALKPLEPDSVPGLRIDDELEALNAQARVLKAQGVRALVALLHEGAGAQGATVTDCSALSGPARTIAAGLDPEYDLVLSAHTHAVYACSVGERWLLQAGANGQYLSVVDLQLDPASGDFVQAYTRNVPAWTAPVRLDASAPVDPAVVKLVDDAVAAAAKIADAPVAPIPGGRISAQPDAEGGSPLGRLVARAHLEAGKAAGAQLACTNPSSVPRDLVASGPGGTATYADVRAVQPYGNRLKLRRVTGAQLRALLGQQEREEGAALLSCAPRLELRAGDQRVLLDGRALTDDAQVIMVANSYLARGGQKFTAIVDAPEAGDAGLDLDALLFWLRKQNGGARP